MHRLFFVLVLEQANLFERNKLFVRKTISKQKMFCCNQLDTFPYPILPNDFHLYEDQI